MADSWTFTMASGKVSIIRKLEEAHVRARHPYVGEFRKRPLADAMERGCEIPDPSDVYWYIVMSPDGGYITHCRTFEDCKALYEHYMRDKIVSIAKAEKGRG